VQYPVSVQICTLNSAGTLRGCIEAVQANCAAEIIVIDGGSVDHSIAIANESGASVIHAGRVGLAQQRRLGFEATNLPYIAVVDADDRIDRDWIAAMLEILELGGYAALQGCLRTPEPRNWLSRSWDAYFQETVRPIPDTHMVGRPALYRSSALRKLPTDAYVHSMIEDTFISRQFEQLGLRQGIAAPLSYRSVPGTWRENLEKWQRYGHGYRRFVQDDPGSRNRILKHLLWTIPVKRSIGPLRSGFVTYPVFAASRSFMSVLGYLGLGRKII